ncbi:MAG: dihydroxy-acid dehydratase [Pedosphaera sp.]|nr:dihydroxy-acid dehydratase [Pedosphaera sp.]
MNPSSTSKLRSRSWLDRTDRWGLAHRSSFRAQGFSTHVFEGRPVIGICNSWSELNHCSLHLKQMAEAVKRGVWAAGGFPLEFPTISLGELLMKPSTMLYRNLMSMDVEESIRAHPLDGVVLLGNCDKTVPAQLMGAISADIPAIMVTAGPQLRGMWRGQEIGSGTAMRKYWDEYRAGGIGAEEWSEIEGCLVRSAGTCGVMGTASTMAALSEALGMALPGSADIPAVDSRRMAAAEESGYRIVALARDNVCPTQIITAQALENAIRVNMAIGGSTNAIIHLIAIAGRLGLSLPLTKFDEISRATPLLVNVQPSGKYLMEDLFYAGGLRALMKEIMSLLHGAAMTVSGKTIAENVAQAVCDNGDVIRPLGNPLKPDGGTVVLWGNLAPQGAVIKQSAASTHLLKHRGRVVVFDGYEDLLRRVNDPTLDVDAKSVMVMKGAGPKGGPGMPEWGDLPIPEKLLKAGIKDMVRLSDARMSGTSFGTVILHVAPEAAIGGPLAIVENGDEIELDVANRRLELLVSADEINRRLEAWRPPPPHFERGYGKMYLEHILQADQGCDFDFLRATATAGGIGSVAEVPP